MKKRYSSLSEFLSDLLQEKKENYDSFSKSLGIIGPNSNKVVGSWVRGVKIPRSENLRKISIAYGLPMEYLVTLSHEGTIEFDFENGNGVLAHNIIELDPLLHTDWVNDHYRKLHKRPKSEPDYIKESLLTRKWGYALPGLKWILQDAWGINIGYICFFFNNPEQKNDRVLPWGVMGHAPTMSGCQLLVDKVMPEFENLELELKRKRLHLKKSNRWLCLFQENTIFNKYYLNSIRTMPGVSPFMFKFFSRIRRNRTKVNRHASSL